MHMTVEQDGRPVFSVPLPNIIQLSPGALHLLTKHLDGRCRAWADFFQGITQEELRRLTLEIARCRKAFPDWILVEMFSGDGARISIRL